MSHAPHLRETLEPLLLDLFEQAAVVEAEGSVAALMAYHQCVAELGRVARQRGLAGLSYVCMLVESGVIRLVASSAQAGEGDRTALAGWPALVLAELLHPIDDGAADGHDAAHAGNTDTSWAMLHSLRHQPWFPAITAQHIELVERRLTEDRLCLAMVDLPVMAKADEVPMDSAFASLDWMVESEPADIATQPMDLKDGFMAAAAPTSTSVPFPMPPCAPSTAEDDSDAVPMAAQEDTGSPELSGGVTHEELAMLSEAVQGLRDEIAHAMTDAAPNLADALQNQVEQLPNIVNAANLVGLTGLRQVLEVALINTAALQAEDAQPSDEQLGLLLQWPELAMDYLQTPDATTAQALIAALMHPAWPLPAEAEAAPEWLAGMASVRVLRARASEGRPTQALPEHVDLAVPSDIDRKVLDSLLQELPPHALAFSELVQRLAQGGTLDDAEQARRVAHTLKGAANTVGIKGVANLTHALEDILVAFGREARMPGPSVCDILLEAADCLEAMSEALLSGGAAPPESLQVHQRVLDCANLIDRDGLPCEALVSDPQAEAVPPTPEAGAAHDAPASAQDEDAHTETYLRVPASLIESLLKLAGESSVLTSQIQDRVKHLGDHINALRTGSRHFGQLSAELEQLVDVRGLAMLGGNTGELDALEMDQYNELHMLSRRIVESGADSREFARAFEREVTGLRDLIAEKERMQMALQRTIQRTRMVEVASVVPRLQRTVRQAARVLGRSVSLRVQGEQTLVDTQLLDRIIDPLMHLLRNAVDHGVEPAEVREAQGKPPEGCITLSFKGEGNGVAIRCEDDGAGMDLAAIRQRAASVGLIRPDEPLSDAQVMRLILVPGFSTRTQTTQISGRGIGMDVVQRAVLDLRGTLEMASRPGQGSVFDMQFPVSMSTVQVMLTRSDTHLLALSVRGVEQILPAREEVEQGSDGSLHYLMQGERLPALRLESLLGLPPEAFRQEGVIEAAMIIRDEFRRRRAVIVPELIESRIVVVKPFHASMPAMLGVDGATVLGDGAVASVLDLPDLVRGFQADARPAMSQIQAAPVQRLPLCLVVDDSVSVRRTMEQLMHDSGYEVMTARDGVDALGVVQSRAPDIVLVDLEMPRMNGLELTSALRNRMATRATPVVMITSRFTDKHRQLASDAGVNAFLTKPYSEDLLLNTMDGLLRSAA